MSVMMISPQMIADAHEKAQWFFKNYCMWEEDSSMCPILAKMSETQISEFFLRLYYLNSISYDILYREETTPAKEFEDIWPAIVREGKKRKRINIYQFLTILRFLSYNIEFEEIRRANKSIPTMDSDEKLLNDIINEMCYMIVVHRVSKDMDLKWYYS